MFDASVHSHNHDHGDLSLCPFVCDESKVLAIYLMLLISGSAMCRAGSVHGRLQSIGWQAQNPEEFEGEPGGDKKDK